MNISCPLCQHNKFAKIYNNVLNNKIAIVKCSKCSHHYSYFTHELDEEKLYSEEGYKMKDRKNSPYYLVQKAEFTRILESIESFFIKPSINLLDFGCGKGLLMHFAEQRGHTTYGIETAKERADYAQNILKLNVSQILYTGGAVSTTKFDTVIFSHVVEHLNLPQNLLTPLLSDNLLNDGLLVIEVPNFKSLQSIIAKDKWIHLDINRHVNHFDVNSLNSLINSISFKTLKSEFFSIHLGIPGMIQALMSIFGYSGNILTDMKEKRFFIFLCVIILFPLALILEFFSALLGYGGVIRLFARKQ
jgi:cyclopropane fatty-acyl-phospholipid synthase-like methyltransferase